MNFYREPRFYAWLGFDRCIFEGAGQPENESYYLQSRKGEQNGYMSTSALIMTGYYLKKLVNPETINLQNAYSPKRYTYPLIRLADLYLLYAEALNEIKASPDRDVYEWIDRVRTRAGLKGVVESWENSTVPRKPAEKETMREIIKRERMIELSFESQRFHDLRRWKDAMKYFNQPIRGWYYLGSTVATYYQATTYHDQVFTPKEYLWPLKISTLMVNGNLEQNPGWK
jgi:hypothetical protein